MPAIGTLPRTLHRGAAIDLAAEIASAPELFQVRCASPDALADHRDVNLAAGLRAPTPDAPETIPEHLRWDWLPASAKRSGTGLAFVYKRSGSDTVADFAVAPPFPIVGASRRSAECIDQLRRSLAYEGSVAIVDLHAGKSWIGIARGGRLAHSRTIARYVQRRHRAGGQSANRFRRNRLEWQRKFHAKLADALADIIGHSSEPVTWLALAGDQTAAKSWLAESDIEQRCGVQLLPRAFDSRGTSRAGLSQIARAIWSARLYANPARDTR